MTGLLYFLAGLLVAIIGIVITLRAQPVKRLCGYVESTTTFDKEWVFSDEHVRFLFNDLESDLVIHHVFYVWNGGSSVIRATDLPNGYVAKLNFSAKHVNLVESRKIGTAFDAHFQLMEDEWFVMADHMDKGHALWCHFVEAVPVGQDPSSITIEGYVLEGGEMLTEVPPISVRRAVRALRLPVLFLLLATSLAVLPNLISQMENQTKNSLFLIATIGWLIITIVHFKTARSFFTGYRYRVPPEYDEIVGRFHPVWSKQEVESRLGVRFPS